MPHPAPARALRRGAGVTGGRIRRPDRRRAPGAPGDRARRRPAGIRTIGRPAPTATRIVLVRHGEAVCNVSGVVRRAHRVQRPDRPGPGPGGRAARDRLAETGELAGADALYASVLPRAIETAELLAPALASGTDGDGPMAPVPSSAACASSTPARPTASTGPSSAPGSATRTGTPIPTGADRPGRRELDRVRQPGGRTRSTPWRPATPAELVVVACHAGVIESSLLAKLPVVGGPRRGPAAAADPARLADHLGGRRRSVAPARLQRRRPPRTGARPRQAVDDGPAASTEAAGGSAGVVVCRRPCSCRRAARRRCRRAVLDDLHRPGGQSRRVQRLDVRCRWSAGSSAPVGGPVGDGRV